MKILFLTNVVPLPCNDGRKLRQVSLLRALARRHEVTLLSFAECPPEKEESEQLKQLVRDFVAVPLRVARIANAGDALGKLACLWRGDSFGVLRYASPSMRGAITEFLSQQRFDLLWCDSLHMSVNLPPVLSLPSVLSLHNVESQILARYVERTPNPLQRILARAEQRNLEHYERRVIPRFDHVAVCSALDQNALQPLMADKSSSVVPNVVDTDHYRPTGELPQPDTLVFTGAMDWFPNRDAVEFFLSRIFPLIRSQIPEVQFTTVGRNPGRALKRLAGRQQGVTLTGYVPDTRPYISSSALFVVPLRIGGGTRLKILEALALGRPVISTMIGAEGLDLKDGRDLAIADSPEEFARETVRLLRSTELRTRLAEQGRKIVLENYGLANVEQSVDKVLARIFSVPTDGKPLARDWVRKTPRPQAELGHGEVGDAVVQETTQALLRRFSAQLAAVILTGSMARGEGSVLCYEGRRRVLGDVEFVVVFREDKPRPRLAELEPLRGEVEARLREQGIQCHLDFSAVTRRFFERQRPHIFSYELKTLGRTVWGEPSFLDLIPSFSTRDIPKEDAWRMLCNRIIEQLRAVLAIWRKEPFDYDATLYELTKFKLDQATSLLVFGGRYAPTYAQRAQRMAALARRGDLPDLAIPLASFADRTRVATDHKLQPRLECGGTNGRSPAELRTELLDRLSDCVPLARALWEWELARLLKIHGGNNTTQEDWKTWLHGQSTQSRLRGWAYLCWHHRMLFSPTEWGRTLRLMKLGSPRYLNYVAGSLLYFALPEFLAGREITAAAIREAQALLPARRYSKRHDAGWVQVCQDVVWNYEQFLIRTRS